MSVPCASRDRDAFTPTHGKLVHHAYARYGEPVELQASLQEAKLTSTAGLKCGVLPVPKGDVSIRKGKHGAYLTGLRLCRSVHGCAACREDKLAAVRHELREVYDFHVERGGIVRMLTLTCPHEAGERLLWVLRDLLAAWGVFTNSRAVRDLQKQGTFFRRLLEVVHGAAHGWHPHFHVPMFLPAMSADEEERVVAKLRAAWIHAVKKASRGHRVPVARHQDWSEDVHPAYAAKGDVRQRTEAEPNGKAVFALARAAASGDEGARDLFREYLETVQRHAPCLATPWTKGHPEELLNAVASAQVIIEHLPPTSDSLPTATPDASTSTESPTEAPCVSTAVQRDAERVPVRPPAGTVVAVIPRKYWRELAPIRGIKRSVLQAADERGLDGVVDCVARALWHRTTGHPEHSTPGAAFDVVREAIRPRTL